MFHGLDQWRIDRDQAFVVLAAKDLLKDHLLDGSAQRAWHVGPAGTKAHRDVRPSGADTKARRKLRPDCRDFDGLVQNGEPQSE